MKRSIFREYDIRGRVGIDFTVDQMYELAQTIAFYFYENFPKVKIIVVGMDGRVHSPIIKEYVCKALTDSGMDVYFIGCCPSPILYFALHTIKADAGIMITASHNTGDYNGLKLCLKDKNICGKLLQNLYERHTERSVFSVKKRGAIRNDGGATINCYVQWMVNHFAHLKKMRLPIVIDCGNGTAGTVLPELIKAMQWEHVDLLYPEVDGTFPYHQADPVQEKNMIDVKYKLLHFHYEIGIGFDGDGDRMAAMTKSGYLVPGDQLLALFSQKVLEKHPGVTIISDIKSSQGVLDILTSWGAQFHLSPAGHAIIKNMMMMHGALLGGELSCHFFFKDRYFGYDDGIYAMMRLLEILIDSYPTPLEELLQVIPKKITSQEFRLPCSEEIKRVVVKYIEKIFSERSDITLLTIDGVRATTKNGWGLIRPSNTQSALSLRFESDTKKGLQKIKKEFIAALSVFFAPEELEKQLNI